MACIENVVSKTPDGYTWNPLTMECTQDFKQISVLFLDTPVPTQIGNPIENKVSEDATPADCCNEGNLNNDAAL